MHRQALRAVLISFCVLLVTTLCGSSCAAQISDSPLGHWEGVVTYRGAEMPVRLKFASAGGETTAELDIPSMLMAWEPIPTAATDAGPEIELPFGLGKLTLTVDGETSSASRMLGDNELKLNLRRTAPPSFRKQDDSFSNGEVELAATIVTPNGEGPFPAVLLIHGSGKQGRGMYEYRSWADLLVRQGLAVMYYDKRGVGDSGGEYGAGLRQLANDALAALSFLRGQSKIDGSRIGLMGGSQGAWIAEQVAADDGNVAFLMLVSAAAGTPRDQDMQQLEYGMRDDGRPESEIESALAYAGLYFYVARTGEGWPLLQQAIARAQQEEWGQYVDQPRSLEDLNWWHENHALQTATLVKDLKMPVLLMYGGADWITPPIENAQKLVSLFPQPDQVELKIFAAGDHRLELPMGEDENGTWQWPRVAAVDWPGLAQWLVRNKLN